MCGIAGELNWAAGPDLASVRRMTEHISYRGPDAGGVVDLGPVALGHRRLSIIDLSADSDQPFTDADRRLWIVYNGEIYNFQEIRARLEQRGVRFRTAGDTEVIVEAYKEWGPDAFQSFNGQFALALWDVARQTLVLVRDRLGKKPLYYARTSHGLVFASELGAVALHPAVCADLSMPALGEYLSLNYTVGETTLQQHIKRLPAAHYMVLDRRAGLSPVRYWNLAQCYKNKRLDLSFDEAASTLKDLLLDATRLRMISDVPLGAFLSGGIDSAAIVASMTALRNPALNRTFSIGFSEPSFSELDGARQSARFFGVDHTAEIVNPDVCRLLPDLPCANDEPMADTSAIPLYILSEVSRRSVKVCLSGDGGDEIFCGYETYVADKIRASLPSPLRGLFPVLSKALDWMPQGFGKVGLDEKLRRFLSAGALPFQQAHVSWRSIFSPDEKLRLVRRDIAEATEVYRAPYDAFAAHFQDVEGCHYLDQATYVDTKTWLVDDILAKVDRQSMVHALEVRAPFLDHRIVEFAASLPVSFKLKGLTTKRVLREALRNCLPPHVLQAPKRGFNAPLSHWLTDSLVDVGKSFTLSGPLLRLLNASEIERLWSEHLEKWRNHSYKLFTLICLGVWLSRRAP